MVVLAGRGSPVKDAALYASAAGIVWAALATFLKSGTDVLAADGVSAILVHGAVYSAVVAGIVGTVLTPGRPAPRSARRIPIVHGDRQSRRQHPARCWLYGEHFVGDCLMRIVENAVRSTALSSHGDLGLG